MCRCFLSWKRTESVSQTCYLHAELVNIFSLFAATTCTPNRKADSVAVTITVEIVNLDSKEFVADSDENPYFWIGNPLMGDGSSVLVIPFKEE